MAVLALTVFDDGRNGSALYAGGNFTTAGGVSVNHITKWDGTSWSALGMGMSGSVNALTVFDDGGGPALYAGGGFSAAGGVSANRIAKWDGTIWSPLGMGASSLVKALSVFDDGGGPALYAGGWFTTAGNVSANHIAKWDGSSWSPLGTGMGGFSPSVLGLTVFDDGSGPALYAGGRFTTAGGVSVNHIAKWDGSSWSPLGTGMGEVMFFSPVETLTVFDDGSGLALYAGGKFTTAGGVSANNIAKWDGSSWSALGMGLNEEVEALAVFDNGSGPALYAGGGFNIAGGIGASRIAKWDGFNWSPLGIGMNGAVNTLTVFDDGGGPDLYAGGGFTTAGGIASADIAQWSCGECDPSDCNGHGVCVGGMCQCDTGYVGSDCATTLESHNQKPWRTK